MRRGKGLMLYKHILPDALKLGNKGVIGKVNFNRNNRNIPIFKSLRVGFGAMIHIYKASGHPIIIFSPWVGTLFKFFCPFGVGLPAYANAFITFGRAFRNVYIKQCMWWQATAQHSFCKGSCYCFSHGKIGIKPITSKLKPTEGTPSMAASIAALMVPL